MKDVFYQLDNPYCLTTSLDLDEHNRQQMIKIIEQQLPYANYKGGYTFVVRDPDHNFAGVYNRFFEIANEIFKPFDLSVLQRNWCWANVYNKNGYGEEGYVSNLHDHRYTCSINGVFYLNVPDNIQGKEGGLIIEYQGKENIYIPENLDLVIIPSWMPHEPLLHSSDQNRISINMEISTVQPVEEIYTIDRIMKICKPQINV